MTPSIEADLEDDVQPGSSVVLEREGFHDLRVNQRAQRSILVTIVLQNRTQSVIITQTGPREIREGGVDRLK